MSIAHAPSAPAPVRLWFSPTEWLVFVAQPLLLFGVAMYVFVFNATGFRLLLTESTGQKMLIQAGVLLVLNAALVLIGTKLIGRWLAHQPSAWYALTIVLHLGCFVFLYLPALWVLTVGPAALEIMRALAN